MAITRKETQEVVTSIYSRVAKQLSSAKKARDVETNKTKRVMLAGKVKAYTDVLCNIEGRYGRRMTLKR